MVLTRLSFSVVNKGYFGYFIPDLTSRPRGKDPIWLITTPYAWGKNTRPSFPFSNLSFKPGRALHVRQLADWAYSPLQVHFFLASGALPFQAAPKDSEDSISPVQLRPPGYGLQQSPKQSDSAAFSVCLIMRFSFLQVLRFSSSVCSSDS